MNQMDSDPVGILNQITVFCHQVDIESKKTFLYYQIELGKVYAHNQVITKARSNVSSKYWGSGFWAIFNDI
ncbi:MAG: hypothetical protein LBT10_05195 [Methanobrevibacter sp.]|nr:hypothetical protein [Methanobrevibacter sp.]